MSDHDLIIRGGTVVDGTGAPARTADVAIDDGVITEVGDGRRRGRARRSTPTACSSRPASSTSTRHYDGQASWDERMIPSSWHGVTTVVVGNCGVGFAPVRPADHDRLIELMEGVEDIPGAVLHEGLAWNWQSFPEFLDALDGRPFDVDVAVQVPARRAAPARDGRARRAARDRDAPTTSTRWRGSRARGDRSRRARLHDVAHAQPPHEPRRVRRRRSPPRPTSSSASPSAIGATGQGVLQVVSDFADVDAEFAIFRRMAEESGRPLSFSLVQVRGDGWRRQLELLGDGERRRRRDDRRRSRRGRSACCSG